MADALTAIGKSLAAIETIDLAEFLAVRFHGASASRWNRAVSALRSFFGSLYAADELDANPASWLEHRGTPWSAPATPLPTKLELVRLFARAEERDRALLAAIYAAPLSSAEAAQLRGRDVHVDDVGPLLVLTGPRARALRIEPRVFADLRRLQAGRPDDAPLFGARSARQIRRVVADVTRRLGRPLTIKQLRDAHVQHALEGGAPSVAIARALGVRSVDERVRRVVASRPSSTYLGVSA